LGQNLGANPDIPSVKSYSEESVLLLVLGQSQGCYSKFC